MPDERSGYRAFVRVRYGDSRQQELILNPEHVIVAHSPFILTGTALTAWAGVYITQNRQRARYAVHVLRHGSKRESNT